jgi:hypothetical protein
MSKKARIWYWILAPVLFVLSWIIGNQLYHRFVEHSKGMGHQPNRAFSYACIFTAVYILVYFVIQDLYPSKKKSEL